LVIIKKLGRRGQNKKYSRGLFHPLIEVIEEAGKILQNFKKYA